MAKEVIKVDHVIISCLSVVEVSFFSLNIFSQEKALEISKNISRGPLFYRVERLLNEYAKKGLEFVSAEGRRSFYDAFYTNPDDPDAESLPTCWKGLLIFRKTSQEDIKC